MTAADPTPKSRRVWSVRSQLLIVVNLTLSVLVAIFLVIDYERELSVRVDQKQVALNEEAKTLLPAVQRLRSNGMHEIQQHLDAVCSQIHDADSPGHHIATRINDEIVQSTAHGRASPSLFSAMQRASRRENGRLRWDNQDLIVGTAQSGDVTTFVSENSLPLRDFVLRDVAWRLFSLIGLGVVSAVLVSTVLVRQISRPLKELSATVAEIAAGNYSTRAEQMNNLELREVTTAINTMSESLQADADEHMRERQQARQLQEHLLPDQLEVPGLNIAAFYRPAAQVAGDYYDVLELRDGTWLLCVADVCGHGVPAAMSSAILKTLVVHGTEHHLDPADLLAFVNQRFSPLSPPDQFASMLLLRWKPEQAAFDYAGAGNEPGFFQSRDSTVTTLESTGLLLGIDSNATWTSRTIRTSPGSSLLLTTDGVSETMNAAGELFGRERLGSLFPDSQEMPDQFIGRLDGLLKTHRNGGLAMDDITILAAQVTEFEPSNCSRLRPHLPGKSTATT